SSFYVFLALSSCLLSMLFCFFYFAAFLSTLSAFPTRRSSDLNDVGDLHAGVQGRRGVLKDDLHVALDIFLVLPVGALFRDQEALDRKGTRLNSSHVSISYAVFCLKKKKHIEDGIGYQHRVVRL